MWLSNILVILSVFGAIYGAAENETEAESVTLDDFVSFSDGEVKTEDGVLVLTKDNFEFVIKNNEFVLVEFYAPWCQHCQDLAPEYAKAAQELEEKGSKIKLGKVDGTEEITLVKDFSVRGYPTLKFFRRGTPIDYTGGRQAEDIVNWLNKKSGPVALDLESVEAVEEFIKSEPVVIIGFFKDLESPEVTTFLNVANTIDEPFGITNNDDVLAKYEAKFGSIILFKSFDEGKAVFDGESTEEVAIREFIALQSMPLIVDFNSGSAKKAFTGAIKNHFVMFVSNEAGHYEKYVEPAKDLAKQFRNKVIFITINVDEEANIRVLNYFDVKKEEIPSMRLIRSAEDMAKYKPRNAELSPENIKSFVQDFLDGKLKRHLVSQELPEDWDAAVKTLVSTNFDEVALNMDKDVLVQFYAPWSEECKELAPIFDQLGEKYKDSETIVIAKIDATANQLEGIEIRSFPTLKFYKKGDNDVIDYNGRRTLEDIIRFVESGGKQEEVEEEQVEEEDAESEESVEENEPPRDEF